MPFPLPTPAELTRRTEGHMERAVLEARPDASPAAVARAVRSPRGMLGVISRVIALASYELHLHLRWWGDQYFPDTAEVEQLLRHASIWGVVRRGATMAIGRAEVRGAPGTTIPAELLWQGASGVLYKVLQPVTLGENGGSVIELQAVEAGVAGNAPAGLRLSPISLVAGLDPQEAVVDADGLAGGAEIEAVTSLRDRLLEVIRAPAHGGASFDYPRWVQNTFAASHVKTLPEWMGSGTVGVAVAMGTRALPRPPTPAELAAIGAHLEQLRPVTADIIMIGAQLRTVAFTIGVDPYEQQVRNAVQAALITYFAREATIGGTLYRSRLSEAISAAAGEYRHELTVPAVNFVPAPIQLPTPGLITWVEPI